MTIYIASLKSMVKVIWAMTIYYYSRDWVQEADVYFSIHLRLTMQISLGILVDYAIDSQIIQSIQDSLF